MLGFNRRLAKFVGSGFWAAITVCEMAVSGADRLVAPSDRIGTAPSSRVRQRISPTVDGSEAPAHIITVSADGTFSRAEIEIYSGDTVEWQLPTRTSTIIPISLNTAGKPDSSLPTPYLTTNVNEFTGSMPQAVSGIFTLSPEELPYATQDVTWRSTNFTGVFIRARWNEVHTGPGAFNWAAIDVEIGKAVANGKLYNLGFKAGARGTPQWIFNPSLTTAPVAKLDFGFKESGKPFYQGSPADANFRQHYSDLMRAVGAHLRERNDHYRALAYIKISGLNLNTHENRLPNDSITDLRTWAGTGRYTPTALYAFYQEQTQLLATEFPDKDMSYALIQDGFPAINDLGESQGQSTPLTAPIPKGSDQTEYILRQGRTNQALRFAVQHNGLQTQPAACPGHGTHPVMVDPKFNYVGSGCPNRWVLAESTAGQVTGYQDVAGVTNVFDLESTFQNEWDNSDGVFLEVYEGIGLVGDTQRLTSGMTIGQWADRFHERRRALFPHLPDPFPLIHRHTFVLPTGVTGTAQSFYYISASPGQTGVPKGYGRITVFPVLSFLGVTPSNDGSTHLNLRSGRAGKLQLEASDDLATWRVITSTAIVAGVSAVTDSGPQFTARYYRASLQ